MFINLILKLKYGHIWVTYQKVMQVWTVKNATTKTQVVNKFQFPFTTLQFRRSIFHVFYKNLSATVFLHILGTYTTIYNC